MWTRWIQFALAHPEAMLFLETHHHSPYLDASSMTVIEKANAAFLAFMEVGLRDRIFKPVPPPLLKSFIAGVITQLLKDSLGGQYELTPEAIEQAEEMCWQAIRS